MCGIFGLVVTPGSSFPVASMRNVVTRLFELSESRGKDASGLAIIDPVQITVLKRPQRARDLIHSAAYRDLFATLSGHDAANQSGAHAVIGHARMVTNGSKETHANNQPVLKHDMVCLHNGIVVNDEALWAQYPSLDRQYEVDTEVILSLINHFERGGATLANAVSTTFQHLKGANSLAVFSAKQEGLILASSNGSLYFIHSDEVLLFASEKYILEAVRMDQALRNVLPDSAIHHVEPGEGYAFSLDRIRPVRFKLGDAVDQRFPSAARQIVDLPTPAEPPRIQQPPLSLDKQRQNDRFVERVEAAVGVLRRCSKCLLPETFPFIHYDENGVCNYCHNYRSTPVRGEAALEALVAPFRRADGQPDCLVPLSGGRDSSYAVHYIKTVLGMNPVAYTYDWGMVTDLARRNISRMCGALGVEHVLVSADIRRKRANIRKNVLAWLKKPNLGTVPLFMAGDKQFFYYANMLKKMMSLDLVMFSQNDMERTDFKTGFCGIDENNRKGIYWNLSVRNKIQMALFYGREFVRNPAFINDTMLDTASGFFSYYLLPRDFTLLYQYVPWDETLFSQTLRRDYDWELATDTDATWRIGDGTAPFYNYIYYVMAGFTENDTFRSNQIREGLITREQGLEMIVGENRPRYESMQWYCDAVGIDLSQTIDIINRAPRQYAL